MKRIEAAKKIEQSVVDTYNVGNSILKTAELCQTTESYVKKIVKKHGIARNGSKACSTGSVKKKAEFNHNDTVYSGKMDKAESTPITNALKLFKKVAA
ncbi:hypothetical protein OCF84_21725 (plasmid) [Shewanella xiamenensis]|uniref:Uncharacterized protein n=1 Tax=Shewanella xiamenensis TaxID=332186 RepID=A0ABT6UDP0_9GAMM|nr:hypothetical protein [Shewanella xiamenensis]MDI5832501.1 hypothetical protein [Shewanella xiamenensis]WHF57880.1 hypothetical protein OCF84_21725 [Shewanella xiamenensis]